MLYRHNLSSASRVRLELLSGTDVIHDTGDVNISGLIRWGFRFGVDPWGAMSTDIIPVQQVAFWMNSLLATGYRGRVTPPIGGSGHF